MDSDANKKCQVQDFQIPNSTKHWECNERQRKTNPHIISHKLNRKLILCSLTGDIILPAGNNSYPFEVQLLRKIPTSYEGTYGYIRYTTTLHINRSAKKIDPLKEIFTVINPLNLNNSPSYRVRFYLNHLPVQFFMKCFFVFVSFRHQWKSEKLPISTSFVFYFAGKPTIWKYSVDYRFVVIVQVKRWTWYWMSATTVCSQFSPFWFILFK